MPTDAAWKVHVGNRVIVEDKGGGETVRNACTIVTSAFSVGVPDVYLLSQATPMRARPDVHPVLCMLLALPIALNPC